MVEASLIEKLDPKEIVSFEKLILSNVYTQGGLITLIEAKGREIAEALAILRK